MVLEPLLSIVWKFPYNHCAANAAQKKVDKSNVSDSVQQFTEATKFQSHVNWPTMYHMLSHTV